jgi:hypothetical protein
MSDSQSGGWGSFAQKLYQEIAVMNVVPATQLRVLVQSDAVNYLVLPPSQLQIRYADKLAYAQAAYCEVHGLKAQDWQICYNDVPPSQSTLNAAIEPALLATIHEVADRHQLRLTCVQPYLSSVMNRLRGKLVKATTLVVIEPARLLVVRLEQGVLVSVRVLRHGEHWLQTLMQVLQRDVLLNPKLPKMMMIYASQQQDIQMEAFADWKIERISLGGYSTCLEQLL